MNYNEDFWEMINNDPHIKDLKENNASKQQLKNPINSYAERYIRYMVKDCAAVSYVYRTDILCPEVDNDSKTDVVADLKNGEKLFIPVAKDVWSQTAQMDRMKMFLLKHDLFDLKAKYENQKKPNYIFVVYGDLNYALSDNFLKAKSVRKKGIQEKLKFLVANRLLMDLNRLKIYLDELV